MNENKIHCKDVMNHICESLGEELNSPRCLEIKMHLEGCSVCKNYFKSVETTITFYKEYDVTMPDEAHNKLIEKLGLEE